MARRAASRARVRGGGGRVAARRGRLRWWPGAAAWQGWLRRLRRAPPAVRATVVMVLLALAALAVNTLYQVWRKPTELFFPVSGSLYKTPQETWREYSSLFRRGRLSCTGRHRAPSACTR